MATPKACKFSEAASRLAVSESTLRRMAEENRIRVVKISSRRLIVPESEIDRLLGGEVAA